MSELFVLNNIPDYYGYFNEVRENPTYTPKRTKLKGYEKERGSFNKKRRAQK